MDWTQIEKDWAVFCSKTKFYNSSQVITWFKTRIEAELAVLIGR